MTAYDVIVIGSGAGGGTLVNHLASSGRRILLLERGGWLPREPQNWRAEDVFIDNRYVSPDTWYHSDEQLYQVHGARGEDPTEPPASAPYPFPAVSHEPRIQNAIRVGDHLLVRMGISESQEEPAHVS